MDTLSLGKHNPRLADIRRALDRGELTHDGLLPIEGMKLIDEAQRSGLKFSACFIREGTEVEGLPANIGVTYTVESSVFKSIQSTETSQGIMALVTPRKFDLEQLLAHASSTIVILVGLQDPGNVGTILRIAEAFGSYACLGVKGTASLYNPKVVRASAGSIFRLPHVWDLEFETVVERLNRAQIALIGTSPYGSQSITDWDWTSPAAVLIGNEGAGLSNQQVKACSALLKIPQQPQVESLNSAIAAAVILYEAFRSRGIS